MTANISQKSIEDDSDRYFVITMTNDAFSYNPETNLITVDPGAEKIRRWRDDRHMEGSAGHIQYKTVPEKK